LDKELKVSYEYCERVARKQAKNFYYAFTVLPQQKRAAICAVYAFMRFCDDISDSDNPCHSKIEALNRWRDALDAAVAGDFSSSKIMPAFHNAVHSFNIPTEYFHELIDGAEMDLSINRYRTFDDLYKYCYRVASVVGLVCIHIFGFNEEKAKEYAEYQGIAFQLTNILRDVKEDADRNRIYIPQSDIEAYGYSEIDLVNGVYDDRFRALMKAQVERARDFYHKGSPILGMIDPSSRGGLAAMTDIYSSILNRIESKNYDVFAKRISLTTSEKLAIAARSIFFGRSDASDSFNR